MNTPTAREAILNRIRRGLGRGALPAAQREAVLKSLSHPRRHTLPARTRQTPDALADLFIDRARSAQASVETVPTAREVPARLAAFVTTHNLAPAMRVPAGSDLATLPWAQAGLSISTDAPDRHSMTGVTDCFAAIAESGTLMVRSGAGRPHALHLVTDRLIVLVRRSQIVGSYEDAFDLARARFGPEGWPRILAWITGPSRTADIAGTILFGAHGPRQVHILLIDSD